MRTAPFRRFRVAGAVTLLVVAGAISASTAGRKFYSDDPIAREPESQDASAAEPWDIDLFYDLGYNLFVTGRRPVADVRAGNINTVDEVPDSSWFTNRIGTREMTDAELVRGPDDGEGPDASKWTVIREKSSGFAPGFTARDAKGGTWFVSFDPPSNPEGASGALVVATKIFYALGYNQVDSFITDVRPDGGVDIDPKATVKRPNGSRTPMTRDDLAEILERAHSRPDGSYRAAAGRLIEGKILGGFRYKGTRPDDPNDIVPHEHRRELRALRVFGAWTNLTDMKAGNTLDSLVTDGGRKVVRHYLQDVGSTFGMGANGPHDWDEGFEYIYDGPDTRHRLLTFGFGLSPWQLAKYEPYYKSIGRFEAGRFDPTTWKPRVPTAAYLQMRDDDAFWAAQRVMAFSDAAIRAIVTTGQFTEPGADKYLGDTLIARRDKIGREYLTRLVPVVSPALDASGTLTFVNIASRYALASEPRNWKAAWFAFDNATGESTPIGDASAANARLTAPSGLPSAAGAYVRVDVSADHPQHPRWATPVRTYFRREASGWKLVGLERLPEATPAATARNDR
jgi:hypothetical protein